MIIKNQTKIPKNQNIPHHVDMWYDRHSRNWIVQLKDVYDNQIREAEYSHKKETALKNKLELQKQCNRS